MTSALWLPSPGGGRREAPNTSPVPLATSYEATIRYVSRHQARVIVARFQSDEAQPWVGSYRPRLVLVSRLIERLADILKFMAAPKQPRRQGYFLSLFRALIQPRKQASRVSPKVQAFFCAAHGVNHIQGRQQWRLEKLVMRSLNICLR